MLKGTNGRLANFSAQKKAATSGAVKINPMSAPNQIPGLPLESILGKGAALHVPVLAPCEVVHVRRVATRTAAAVRLYNWREPLQPIP